MEPTSQKTKLKRAKLRVKKLKEFYDHLLIYCIVNILIIAARIYASYQGVIEGQDPGFIKWIDYNTFSVAIFWGIGLIVHALFVFKFSFLNKWEQRKINEFMEKDSANKNTFKNFK